MDTSLLNTLALRGDLIVVDDSRTALAVMGRRLTELGYSVTLIDNGVTALDLVQSRRFDAMLLDITMPEMSGMAVLRELRSSPVTAGLPVLMMTARSDPAAAIDALNAGADDHVVKPFDVDVMAARIERLLGRAREVDALRRANAVLDGRIAQRAVEISELRMALAEARAALSR
jgi:DNA-binding response OmpR family regulator